MVRVTSVVVTVAAAGAVCALVLAAGCHHAPRPAPPPAERDVHSPADIAGHWRFEDDMDFSYRLAIDASGKVDLVVDRSRMGTCEQVGALATPSAGAAPKTFTLTYSKDGCNTGIGSAQQVASGYSAPLTARVVSFTGDALVLEVTGAGVNELRHYRRDASAAAADPAQQK